MVIFHVNTTKSSSKQIQYVVHCPLWPHRGYDSDCNAVDYARKQAFENEVEGSLMFIANAIQVVASGLYLLWSIFLRKRNLNSPASSRPSSTIGRILPVVLFGWLAGMNFQYTLHYQHDMHHLVGNLVHHAGEGTVQEVGVGGARFGNSIPHGLFPTLILYEAVVPFLVYLAAVATEVGGHIDEFIASALLISPLKMAMQSRIAHPYLHANNQSMFPYPLSLIIDDYNCHIAQHHVDGTCLGVIDIQPLNHFYTILMKVHGSLYSTGKVVRGTAMHDALNVSMDYVLLFATFLTFATFFYILRILKAYYRGAREVKTKIN